MRVKQLKDIDPIHVMPGDSLVLSWREFGRETELLREQFTEARVVNRVAVVELGRKERKELGMKEAIAGVFGRRA